MKPAIIAAALMLTALTTTSEAHLLGVWLSEDAGASNAQYALQVDGVVWRTGVVTQPQSQWQSLELYFNLPDGHHNITVLQTNNDGLLYVAYMTYDNVATYQFPQSIGAGNNFSVDVGPLATADTPPPAAAYAGFTTHVLHQDFTQSLPANWLGGCPNGMDGSRPTDYFADDRGHTWHLNLWWWYGRDTCSIYQVTDPQYGNTAIDLLWVVNRYDTAGTAIETGSPDYNSVRGDGEVVDFPNNAYYEAEYRLDPPGATADGVFITWATSGLDYSKQLGGLEFDVSEWIAGEPRASDSVVHNFDLGQSSQWIMAPGSPSWTNTDSNHYHKFGMLTVTYGNNNELMYACSYIDDVFQACQSVPFSQFDATNRNFLILNNLCDYWVDPTCGDRDGQIQHMYVKSVNVWTNGP